MRIAIISPLVVGIGQSPATYSSQQINLAIYWANAGHEVDVITGRCDGLNEVLQHERIRLFQRPLVWLGGKTGLPLMIGGAWLLCSHNYDMVFSSEHYQPTTLMACLLSRNVVIYQGQNSSGSSPIKRAAFRLLDVCFLSIIRARYLKVIAKTRAAEDFVLAKGLKRCVTIPCGYDATRFRAPSSSEKTNSRKTFDILDDEKVLVYAGNLLPRRDVATAIRALAKLRSQGVNAVLLVAGDGPELNRLKAITRDEGIMKSVHFLGHLSWKKLRQAYWAGDIFIFPSHYEIFGMVLIEALACSLKIVSTPCPAAADILSECPHAGFIAQVGDSLAFATACKTLFSIKQSDSASGNSVSKYLKESNWNSIADRIIEAIEPPPGIQRPSISS